MHFYHLIGMTDKFSHYFGVFVFVFSLTNVVRTVHTLSLYLGPKLYFNLNQISTYFVNKFLVLAKPSRPARPAQHNGYKKKKTMGKKTWLPYLFD